MVFASSVGTPLQERNVRRESYASLKAVALPRIRFHDLRYSCATILQTVGEHPKIVQEMLGHESVQVTLDPYSHLMPALGLKERAAARLDAVLLPAENWSQNCAQTGEQVVSRTGIEPAQGGQRSQRLLLVAIWRGICERTLSPRLPGDVRHTAPRRRRPVPPCDTPSLTLTF
jgi:hypothetical protein